MIAMTSHPWQPGWNVAALVRRPKIVWRETSAPSITAKFPWIFSQYCLEYLVGSKYYRKVSLSVFQILPWISCPLHAMIVILKKVGLVSMDKHLWKWWSQSGQSIFVKTMIFSKMTVSEVLTIIMTNIKPWPLPEPQCIDYLGCCSSRKRPSGTMQDFGRLCFKGEKDDILFEGRILPAISFEGALLQRAWLLPWRKVIKLTSSGN